MFEHHSFGSRIGSVLLLGLVVAVVIVLVVNAAVPVMHAADQLGAAGR